MFCCKKLRGPKSWKNDPLMTMAKKSEKMAKNGIVTISDQRSQPPSRRVSEIRVESDQREIVTTKAQATATRQEWTSAKGRF